MYIYYICNQYADWKTYTGRKEQDKEVIVVKNGLVIKKNARSFSFKARQGFVKQITLEVLTR